MKRFGLCIAFVRYSNIKGKTKQQFLRYSGSEIVIKIMQWKFKERFNIRIKQKLSMFN